MHHPERWRVQGGRLRPVLGTLKLIPGLGGCEADDRGGVKATQARANYEEKGWILIPHGTLPPSQKARGSYLYRLDERPDVVLPYWARAYAGSSALRADLELKYEFLDHLVDSGAVPRAPLYIIERELEDAKRRLGVAEDKARHTPSWVPKAEAIGRELEVLEATLAERLEAEAPTPAGGAPLLPEAEA